MRDSHEDHRPESRCGKRKKKSAAENSKLGEDPAANERANQTEDDVGDATEAAASGKFSSEPTSDQSKQKPGDNAAGPPFDYYSSLLKKSERGEHAISRVDFRGPMRV
jgi:hypothetical protein